MNLDEALIRALHSHSGAPARWQSHRTTGLTDADLKDAICREFGIWGGFSGPGEPGYTYSGGTAPQFWVGNEHEEVDGKMRRKKPTLSGSSLVAAARRVLRIPQPVSEVEQTTLFPEAP